MKKKPPALHPSEQADGDYDGEIRTPRGRKTELQVRTKMGADGVEELHCDYKPLPDRLITTKSLGKRYDEIDWSK